MPVLFTRTIGPIFIDVVVSESATASMEIPTHPVERGAKISDHAWRLPKTLKLENLCEDMGAWDALNDLMAEAEPFDVVSGFGFFENMMIESIEPHRDVIWCDVLYHTVNLKEVIVVGGSDGGGFGIPGGLGNAGLGGDERGLGLAARGFVQAPELSVLSVGAGIAGSALRSGIAGAGIPVALDPAIRIGVPGVSISAPLRVPGLGTAALAAL